MESLLASYSLAEIQQLGQTIGRVLVAVLVLSFVFVAYKFIKRALNEVDYPLYEDKDPEEIKREYDKYNSWG